MGEGLVGFPCVDYSAMVNVFEYRCPWGRGDNAFGGDEAPSVGGGKI